MGLSKHEKRFSFKQIALMELGRTGFWRSRRNSELAYYLEEKRAHRELEVSYYRSRAWSFPFILFFFTAPRCTSFRAAA